MRALLPYGNAPASSATFPITKFGAKGDGMVLTDLSITNGLAVVTSASYQFKKSDEGKMFAFTGVGTAGVVLPAHIVSVAAGAATLSQVAHATKAGNGIGTFGTDNSTAIQKTLTAASVAPLINGGLVTIGAGIFVTAATCNLFSNVSVAGQSMGISILKWISEASMDNPVLEGGAASAGSNFFNCHYRDFQIDCAAAFQTAFSVNGKGLSIPYQTRSFVERLYVHDTPATGIGQDYALQGSMTNNIIINAGRLGNGTTNPGCNGIGNATGGGATLENWYIAGNFIINAKRYGIFFETQSGAVNPGSNARVIGNYVEVGTVANSFGIGDCGLRMSIFANNTVFGNATGGDGIVCRTGTIAGSSPGGQGIITGNTIKDCANGITISYGTTPSSEINKYIVSDNRVQTSVAAGINIVSNAAAVFDTILIEGNQVSLSGTAGLSMTGAGGFKDVSIKDNQFQNNALTTVTDALKSGIYINSPITRLRMATNECFDNQGVQTQKYGLTIDTVAVTGALIEANDFRNNITSGINLAGGGTIAGIIRNNPGYNPVGTTSPVIAASPATFTNGTSPATLYLSGTMTSVVKNGVTIPGLVALGSVRLAPNDTVVITYPGAAPTAVLDTD